MIEGSSLSSQVYSKVKREVDQAKTILICLDSNHTHDHVLRELQLYAPLVSKDSYIIVLDTIVEKLDASSVSDRPWGMGNNPSTAIDSYLVELQEGSIVANDGEKLKLERDISIDEKIMISVAPGGYLRRK